MIRRIPYEIKAHWNLLFLILMSMASFCLSRGEQKAGGEFIICHNRSYNEYRFVFQYVLIYLVTISPLIHRIYLPTYAIRMGDKWNHLMWILRKNLCYSVAYGILCGPVWFVMVGSISDYGQAEGWQLFLLTVFVTQIIGWNLVGILYLLIYQLVRSLPLAFVAAYVILIATNLSLYMDYTGPVAGRFRLFRLMYDPKTIGNGNMITATACFYVLLAGVLLWVSYIILKNQDYLTGGKRADGGHR